MNTYSDRKLKKLLKQICDDKAYIKGITLLVREKDHKKRMIKFIKNNRNLTPDDVSYYALLLDDENGPSDDYEE